MKNKMPMRNIVKTLMTVTLAGVFAAAPWSAWAAEPKPAKTKPYPLDTCVVSGEKLGGMGDPYVFVHKGQEIKLCCKGCLKDFNKNPDPYLKKIAEAQKDKK